MSLRSHYHTKRWTSMHVFVAIFTAYWNRTSLAKIPLNIIEKTNISSAKNLTLKIEKKGYGSVLVTQKPLLRRISSKTRINVNKLPRSKITHPCNVNEKQHNPPILTTFPKETPTKRVYPHVMRNNMIEIKVVIQVLCFVYTYSDLANCSRLNTLKFLLPNKPSC